ncbi:hypothetical protein J6590_008725 [Homalodisca vitripennis]|nr:hypothetical protein J6590_008725 [Homalodisca vitripennis]
MACGQKRAERSPLTDGSQWWLTLTARYRHYKTQTVHRLRPWAQLQLRIDFSIEESKVLFLLEVFIELSRGAASIEADLR